MPIKTLTHAGARLKRTAAKAFLTYQIRSVEAELHGNHEAFPYIEDPRPGRHAGRARRTQPAPR